MRDCGSDTSTLSLTSTVETRPVNFVEWDGLIRLCFNRKNKTLNSSLRDKKVLKLIEENFKTAASLTAQGVQFDFPARHLAEFTDVHVP